MRLRFFDCMAMLAITLTSNFTHAIKPSPLPNNPNDSSTLAQIIREVNYVGRSYVDSDLQNMKLRRDLGAI